MIDYYKIVKRLKEGKPYTDKFKSYSKQELNDCIRYLIDVEDYESCVFLRDYIKIKFNHKNNYLS